MMAIKIGNEALRFVLELCVLAALCYWGFQIGKGLSVKIVLGIGAPLLAAVVWGLFGAPNATWPLADAWHLLLEVVVFGSAVVALYAAGYPNLAWIFALIVIVNRVLMYVWGQ